MITNDSAVASLSRTMALFNDPFRVKLVLFLAERSHPPAKTSSGRASPRLAGPELCVSEVAEVLGGSVSNTSHQLRKLALAGIVEPYRKGRMICYRFRRTPLAITTHQFLRELRRVQPKS